MGAKQFRGALSSAGDNDENGKRKSKVGEGDMRKWRNVALLTKLPPSSGCATLGRVKLRATGSYSRNRSPRIRLHPHRTSSSLLLPVITLPTPSLRFGIVVVVALTPFDDGSCMSRGETLHWLVFQGDDGLGISVQHPLHLMYIVAPKVGKDASLTPPRPTDASRLGASIAK